MSEIIRTAAAQSDAILLGRRSYEAAAFGRARARRRSPTIEQRRRGRRPWTPSWALDARRRRRRRGSRVAQRAARTSRCGRITLVRSLCATACSTSSTSSSTHRGRRGKRLFDDLRFDGSRARRRACPSLRRPLPRVQPGTVCRARSPSRTGRDPDRRGAHDALHHEARLGERAPSVEGNQRLDRRDRAGDRRGGDAPRWEPHDRGCSTNNPESERADDARLAAFPSDRSTATDVVVIRSTHTRSTRRVSRRSCATSSTTARSRLSAVRGRTSTSPVPGSSREDRHATIVSVALLDDDETEALVEKVEAIDEDGAFAVSVTGEETLDYDFNSSHKRTWRTGSSSSVSRRRSSSCCSSSARSSPGSCRCSWRSSRSWSRSD